MQFLTAAQLRQAMADDKDLLVIAVCDPERFAAGHIAGTINVPVNQEGFLQRIREKSGDPHRPVVLYDQDMDSGLAQVAALSLAGAGFTQTRVYESGLAQWRESGLPVDQGPVQA